MMKFVLISIAVILAGLGIYTYSNQITEKSHSTPSTISKKKKVVQKVEKPSAVTPEVTKQKSSAKNITVKSPKIVSKEPTQEMGNEEEIGKGITQEDIDNARSEEEKQVMIGQMLYYKTTHRPKSEINSLSRKEIYDQIHNDMKKINNQ